jgi:hypothetical protein
MVLRMKAVMALPTSRSPVVTGLPLLSKGHGDVVEALFQVGQVADHGQDGHTLGTHGDAELGLHGEAVIAAAEADDDVAQGLGAEVDNPAHFHAGGVDVQAAHAGQAGQLLVVVVALVLHARGHGHHGQVVGVHDVVDVAGEPQGELGHGNQQGVAAAGRRSLDVHGGAAGRLTQGAAHVDTTHAQAFHQAAGGGAFAFTQGSRGDGGDFDVLAVGFVFETVDDFRKSSLPAAPWEAFPLSGAPVSPAIVPASACFFQLLRKSASLPY